ncbi:sodium/potassium-transporting ATPase subunit beta-1-like [Anticarsia gemmatalis]|uniref:sodium/potassium-transporting ATPase subunit beta-1-like n=1 Tax=Anticarsia gemmatalis TaxID=129554 RepID=UPI003F770312
MTTKVNGNMDDWVRTPPPQGSFCQRFANVIYNPEEKSFLGRTPKRWGIMLTFYLVFYAVLALLFALCMGGLFLSLDLDHPTYLLDHSLIGANPGVTSRPLPENTVLRVKVDNSSDYQQWIDQLDEFFEAYKGERWWLNQKNCTSDDNYGFPDNPCIFIKVNRIVGWEPQVFEANSLPADMPEDLVEHIQSLSPADQKQVWISCEEEKANDTSFEYPWGRGLPISFYPFLSGDLYRSPIVAVKLNIPTNHQVIIRCRAWAHNIIYNKSLKEPSGYTRLQILIEDPTTEDTTEAQT